MLRLRIGTGGLTMHAQGTASRSHSKSSQVKSSHVTSRHVKSSTLNYSHRVPEPPLHSH